MKTRICGIVFSLTLLCACAGEKKITAYTSIPPVQRTENRSFEATFEPLKGDRNFFVSFRLTVKNKTAGVLEMDWNRTRYMFKKRPGGAFVFRGIDPARIKSSTIPPDPIGPGETFSREIFPAGLVAFTPIRADVTSPGGKGINPGPIRAGTNGISLVILQDGKELRANMDVEIRVAAEGNP